MSDIGNINAIREWSRRYFYTKEDINYFVTKLNEGYKGYALTFVGPRNKKVVVNPGNYEFTLNSDGWYRYIFFFTLRQEITIEVEDGETITYQLDAYNDTINLSPYVIATEQMTGIYQPSGYITERQHWNGSPIYVFDRNDASIWECSYPNEAWICYEFPEPKTIYKIKIVTANLGEMSGIDYWGRPRHFDIQVSNNGSDWTTIYTQDKTMSANDNTIEFFINDPKPYIYYRFWQYSADMIDNVTDPENPRSLWTPNYALLKEIYYYTIEQDTSSYQIVTPIMTSNTAPKGEVSASGGTPWPTFNQQVNAGWNSSSAFNAVVPWIQYKFNDGEKHIVRKLRLWQQSNVKQFKLQGSNDGVTFTDIMMGNMRHTEQYYNQIFTVNNSSAYQYYRITVTDAFTASSAVAIARIDLMEAI